MVSTVPTYSEDLKVREYIIVGTLARDMPRKRRMYRRYGGRARWAAIPFPRGCERVEIAKGTTGGTPPPSFTLQRVQNGLHYHPCGYNRGGHVKVAPVQIPPSPFAYSNEQWTHSRARIGE